MQLSLFSLSVYAQEESAPQSDADIARELSNPNTTLGIMAFPIDYIHYNPVKHGYVEKASQWEYSSIHRYIQKGILNREWGVALDF